MRPLALAMGALLGSSAGIFGAVAGIIVTAGGTVLVPMVGVRPLIIGSTLFMISPSAIGEGSFRLSLLGLLIQLITILLAPPEEASSADTPLFRTVSFLVPLLVVMTLVLRAPKFPFEVAPFLLAAFNMTLLCSRPRLIRASLAVVALFVGLSTVSYLLSIVTGFIRIAPLTLGKRPVGLFFPVTFGVAGAEMLPTPRMAILTGEPGLNIFYLMPAVAAVVSHNKWIRSAYVFIVPMSALFGQSTGVMLCGGAGLVLGGLVKLWRRGSFLSLLAAAAVAATAGPRLVKMAVAAKEANNSQSLSDRGFGSAGASGPSAGEVNLMSSWHASAIDCIPVVVALVLILILAIRSLLGICFFLAFCLTAMFLQPTIWMVGAWEMLTMSLVLCEPAVRRLWPQGEAPAGQMPQRLLQRETL